VAAALRVTTARVLGADECVGAGRLAAGLVATCGATAWDGLAELLSRTTGADGVPDTGGRVDSLLGAADAGVVLAGAAAGWLDALLIPMARAAQPATASEAAQEVSTRATDMGPVCQV
jgi:hypothetical protein